MIVIHPRRTEEDEEQPIIVETTVKVKRKISCKEFSELFNRMGGLRKLERNDQVSSIW